MTYGLITQRGKLEEHKIDVICARGGLFRGIPAGLLPDAIPLNNIEAEALETDSGACSDVDVKSTSGNK